MSYMGINDDSLINDTVDPGCRYCASLLQKVKGLHEVEQMLAADLDKKNLQIEELKKKADGTYLVCNYHHLPGCICGRKIQELERLNGELAEALKAFIAADNGGFDTRHAAENSYCPDCASDSDSWRDQTEHHEGCQYLKRMEAAKAAIEKTAPLKRKCPCGSEIEGHACGYWPGNSGGVGTR